MNNFPLSLTLSILLSLPYAVAAASRQSKAPESAVRAVGQPQGSPSLVAQRVLTALESGRPEAIKSLASERSPAGAIAAAAISHPELFADPSVFAEAQRVFGEAAAKRLVESPKALNIPQRPVVSPVKARAALMRLLKRFGAMSTAGSDVPAVTGFESAHAQRLSKPARGGMRTALVAGAMLAGLLPQPVFTQHPARSLAIEASASAPAQTLRSKIAGLLHGSRREAAPAYLASSDIKGAIGQWRPDVHLYTVGGPDIDKSSLKAIADKLAGKPWTVVIVADSDGNSYTDAQGGAHSDLDAVDFGTGQGIYNKGGFADAVEPRTGERSGVIFTIVMRQRKFFFHGSEAMRSHGLDAEGGRPFFNDLENWAKARMRAGGDVLGAVSDTVDNVDALLNEAITADIANAQSAVASAKTASEGLSRTQAAFLKRHPGKAALANADVGAMERAIAQAEKLLGLGKARQSAATVANIPSEAGAALARLQGFESSLADAAKAIARASAAVDELDRAAEAFRRAHPRAVGDLARPDIGPWRGRLDFARGALESDPGSAERAAGQILRAANGGQAELADLEGGAARIAAAQKLEGFLSAKLRAGEAQASLVTARQALREAAEAQERASSLWSASLQTAKAALDDAERRIAAADAAARVALALWWLFNIVAGALTLGVSIFLNRRAARAGAKAEIELKKWDEILSRKLDASSNELEARMETYVGDVNGEKVKTWTDESAALAAQVRRDAGYATLLWSKARQVHNQSTALVRPRALTWRWFINLLETSNYTLAERLLAHEPLAFRPEDGLDAVFGRAANDWRGDLYGEVKDYAPFSKDFAALMDGFNGRAKAAVKGLDELEYALTKLGELLGAIEADAAVLGQRQAGLASYPDGLFRAAPIFTDALKAVADLVAAARLKNKNNPVGAAKGETAKAQRILGETSALAKALVEAREGALKRADEAAAGLAKLSIGCDWISAEKARLSSEADAIAMASTQESVAERIAGLSKSLAELDLKAADAHKGAQALAEKREQMATGTKAVAEARQRIGKTLELPENFIMKEKDLNPSEFLAAAAALADKAAGLLGQGKIDEAKVLYADLQKNLARAAAITDASLESLKTHAAQEKARHMETQRLKALVPERQLILDKIGRDFAASVMPLGAGDVSHPNANGTVLDNIEEATVAIEAAAAKREKAIVAFRAGRLVEAHDLLWQAQAHQEIAQHRLDEISEKRARLDKAVGANLDKRRELEAIVKQYESKVVDEGRTMKATLDAFASAKTGLGKAVKLVEAAKGDPFSNAAALAVVAGALEQAWVMARNDFDARAVLDRSLKAAEAQLAEAKRQSKRAQSDGVADSALIKRGYGELESLENNYLALTQDAKRPHGDWPGLDRVAEQISAGAAHVAAVLKGQVGEAARATDALSQAAAAVGEATNWRNSSYNVYINGSPGSSSLDQARSALKGGDYDRAMREAEAGSRAAASAIEEAEAQVLALQRAAARRRREAEAAAEQRRQEEESRRQRSSYSSSSSSIGSSFGSSSSGGWSGSSSGSSSGGWSGSSSGNSSGGW